MHATVLLWVVTSPCRTPTMVLDCLTLNQAVMTCCPSLSDG
jgi:hypothetical protein